ncbi:hypothetical protein GGI43DRAFT_85725 [Trichoderma evansii]
MKPFHCYWRSKHHDALSFLCCCAAAKQTTVATTHELTAAGWAENRVSTTLTMARPIFSDAIPHKLNSIAGSVSNHVRHRHKAAVISAPYMHPSYANASEQRIPAFRLDCDCALHTTTTTTTIINRHHHRHHRKSWPSASLYGRTDCNKKKT